MRVPCPQPNDSTAPQRILISQCFGSRTISGNHLFRQDSEHGQDLESKSGSHLWKISLVTLAKRICLEGGGKKTCFGSKCEAGWFDGTPVCEAISLYCGALHSLTMKAWSIVLRWPWRLWSASSTQVVSIRPREEEESHCLGGLASHMKKLINTTREQKILFLVSLTGRKFAGTFWESYVL